MIGQDARSRNLERAKAVQSDPSAKPRTKRLAREWQRNLEGDLLPAAQQLRDLGLSVIATAGKVPVGEWKRYQTQRPTPGELREMFGEASDKRLGMAVVCGEVSDNLMVRDFDQAGGYEAWRDRHPALAAELPTVRTGRGFHVYGRIDGDTQGVNLGDGELRGRGQYVIAPPSRHPSGRRYEWLIRPQAAIPWIDIRELLEGAIAAPSQQGITERSVIPRAYGDLTPEAVASLVSGTVPAARGQHHRCVFQYVRQLRGFAELADAGPEVLEPLARQWYAVAKPFTEADWDETWRQFRSGWERVRCPGGSGVDDVAVVAASSPLPSSALRFTNPKLQLLVAVCRELQRRQGDRPFFLSGYSAGQAVGVTQKTAWGWLKLIERNEIIELVEVGTIGTRRTGKASTYRYKGD